MVSYFLSHIHSLLCPVYIDWVWSESVIGKSGRAAIFSSSVFEVTSCDCAYVQFRPSQACSYNRRLRTLLSTLSQSSSYFQVNSQLTHESQTSLSPRTNKWSHLTSHRSSRLFPYHKASAAWEESNACRKRSTLV